MMLTWWPVSTNKRSSPAFSRSREEKLASQTRSCKPNTSKSKQWSQALRSLSCTPEHPGVLVVLATPPPLPQDVGAVQSKA